MESLSISNPQIGAHLPGRMLMNLQKEDDQLSIQIEGIKTGPGVYMANAVCSMVRDVKEEWRCFRECVRVICNYNNIRALPRMPGRDLIARFSTLSSTSDCRSGTAQVETKTCARVAKLLNQEKEQFRCRLLPLGKLKVANLVCLFDSP